MQKTLTIWNYFTIGFGAIIGTGWVLQVGDWMVKGGGPAAAIIAFIIGGLFFLPIGAVFGELTAAIPIAGGIVEYVDRSFGGTLSFITGWLLALGTGIICPWETIAISTLVSEMFSDIFPVLRSVRLYRVFGADVYLFPMLIALAFAAYVIYLNFRGAAATAKLQAFLTKALLCGMVLAMVIALFIGSPSNILPIFQQVTDAPAGSGNFTSASGFFAGVLSVLVITPFFYAGFDTVPQQAEEAVEDLNWNKFGRIISFALLASGAFYVVCIYSFGSMIPWTELVQSPVPALAALKKINLLLYLAMLTIATLGTMGPMNSFYAATTRVLLAMGRKGQIPERFAQLDEKTGVPKTACMLLAVLTMAGPFLGKNMLMSLTIVSSLGFVFGCAMISFAALRMRRTEPNLPRPYKVPGGQAGLWAACICGTIIVLLMIVPFSPAALKPAEWVIVLIWIGLGLLMRKVRSRRK